MNKSYSNQIRQILNNSDDGLTITEIKEHLPHIPTKKSIRKAISFMPDVYIDRWKDPVRGQYQAVFCVVRKPIDCPHPKERYAKPKTKWVSAFPTTARNS